MLTICDLCEESHDGEHTAEQCEANLLVWRREVAREGEQDALRNARVTAEVDAKLASLRHQVLG